MNKRQRVLTWFLNALLIAVLAACAWIGAQQHHLANDGAESHQALCIFQADLERRADDAQKFLDMTLQERISKYGYALGTIDPDTIRNSLDNQRQTLDALSVLDCSE